MKNIHHSSSLFNFLRQQHNRRNIDMIINKAKNDVNADLIAVNSGGFEGSQIEGYMECLTVLVSLMDPYLDRRENSVIPIEDSVNLVGQYRGGPDLKILKEYFNKLHINLNCVLTTGCTLNEVKRASLAYLNISMCEASGIEPCELMEKKI